MDDEASTIYTHVDFKFEKSNDSYFFTKITSPPNFSTNDSLILQLQIQSQNIIHLGA